VPDLKGLPLVPLHPLPCEVMGKVKGVDGADRSSVHPAPLCGRNDCSRPASARLMLDMANRVVSIDMEVAEVGAGMLCYNHAERVVVPRGWTLVDNRVIEPYLFDGAPYDIDDDLLDNHDDEPVAPVRKERKRRKLITPSESSVASKGQPDDGVVTTGEADAADGQLSMGGGSMGGGSYDFPEEYAAASDEPLATPSNKIPSTKIPSSKRSSATVDEIEADKSTSPLLARAFDMTKTRGANPKVKRPSDSPLDDLD
jgi:Protein of unknown function (DUF3499)